MRYVYYDDTYDKSPLDGVLCATCNTYLAKAESAPIRIQRCLDDLENIQILQSANKALSSTFVFEHIPFKVRLKAAWFLLTHPAEKYGEQV